MALAKEKKIKLCITITPNHKHMLEELVEKKGIGSSYSSAIEQLISVKHQSSFPAYIGKRVGLDEEPLTPEEQGKRAAEREIARKETKEKLQQEKLRYLCEDVLGGKAEGVNCRYKTYQLYPDVVRVLNQNEINPLDWFQGWDKDLQDDKTLSEIGYSIFAGGLDTQNNAQKFLDNIDNGNIRADEYPEQLIEYAKRKAKEAKKKKLDSKK